MVKDPGDLYFLGEEELTALERMGENRPGTSFRLS